LKQNFPEARIIGVIRKYAGGALEDGPWLDGLIQTRDKTTRGFFELVRQIRRMRPDFAVVLPNSFRSALICRLGGVKKIYSYRRGGRTILLNGGPKPKVSPNGIVPIPMAEYYLAICAWMGLKIPEQNKPSLYLSEAVKKQGNELLHRYGIKPDDMVIGLNPGAKYGTSKCWPPENFANLAELLVQKWDCKILLFVGPGEAELGRQITAGSKAQIIDTGPDRVDLALLKPLVKRCQLLITNDTGPRHYAVAFDVPCVVIMGPTDPRYTQANLEKTLVLRRELDCSPCHQKQCPLDHRCMTEITPQTVFHESEKLLENIQST
jgi:heptosyltransferase-2